MADIYFDEFDYGAVLVELHSILEQYPDGLSEYDLLLQLQNSTLTKLFPAGASGKASLLYQSHFLLFHLLYKLRSSLLEGMQGDISIHCLNIRLRPVSMSSGHVVAPSDPLQDYYLELENLNISDEEVAQMLARFWQQFSSMDKLQSALGVLGLGFPIRIAEVKARYQRLMMEHHPDRGGEEQKVKQIHAAMKIIKQHLD